MLEMSFIHSSGRKPPGMVKQPIQLWLFDIKNEGLFSYPLHILNMNETNQQSQSVLRIPSGTRVQRVWQLLSHSDRISPTKIHYRHVFIGLCMVIEASDPHKSWVLQRLRYKYVSSLQHSQAFWETVTDRGIDSQPMEIPCETHRTRITWPFRPALGEFSPPNDIKGVGDGGVWNEHGRLHILLTNNRLHPMTITAAKCGPLMDSALPDISQCVGRVRGKPESATSGRCVFSSFRQVSDSFAVAEDAIDILFTVSHWNAVFRNPTSDVEWNLRLQNLFWTSETY
jgi:hypothetical protein